MVWPLTLEGLLDWKALAELCVSHYYFAPSIQDPCWWASLITQKKSTIFFSQLLDRSSAWKQFLIFKPSFSLRFYLPSQHVHTAICQMWHLRQMQRLPSRTSDADLETTTSNCGLQSLLQSPYEQTTQLGSFNFKIRFFDHLSRAACSKLHNPSEPQSEGIVGTRHGLLNTGEGREGCMWERL